MTKSEQKRIKELMSKPNKNYVDPVTGRKTVVKPEVEKEEKKSKVEFRN